MPLRTVAQWEMGQGTQKGVGTRKAQGMRHSERQTSSGRCRGSGLLESGPFRLCGGSRLPKLGSPDKDQLPSEWGSPTQGTWLGPEYGRGVACTDLGHRAEALARSCGKRVGQPE